MAAYKARLPARLAHKLGRLPSIWLYVRVRVRLWVYDF